MPSRFQLRYCAHIFRHQGVIAYPTESVFGLGCDPMSEYAVERILQLKQRPASKGLIIIAADLQQLETYIEIDADQKQKILHQDTPMTWLVNKSGRTPEWISGEHSKIAIRISRHAVVSSLCNEFGGAIVSTSANPAGAHPAKNILQVRQYFPYQLDMYLAGNTGSLGRPTPITDIHTGQQIRF